MIVETEAEKTLDCLQQLTPAMLSSEVTTDPDPDTDPPSHYSIAYTHTPAMLSSEVTTDPDPDLETETDPLLFAAYS